MKSRREYAGCSSRQEGVANHGLHVGERRGHVTIDRHRPIIGRNEAPAEIILQAQGCPKKDAVMFDDFRVLHFINLFEGSIPYRSGMNQLGNRQPVLRFRDVISLIKR